MLQSKGEASPAFTAEELENSFPLDQGRRFAQQVGRDLLEVVLTTMDAKQQRIRVRKAADEQRRRVTLEALLANIVAAYLNVVDPDRFVAVSLSRNFYNGSELSFKSMQDCCKHLRAEGLIEFGPGFRRPDELGGGHFGRRTRLRAAPALRDLIDNAQLGRRSLSRPASQLIRIKERRDGVGEPPVHIEASRAVIESVNRRLADTEIGVRPEVIATLKAEIVADEGEDRDGRERKRRYAGDLTATSIYRAFKGNWKSGGRFYGGWWMSFPKALRPYITLDGEPTVELDYKTLHPLLLYRRAGLDLHFDAYLAPPWQGRPMRELGKRTFNRLLNRAELDPAKRLRMRAAKGDLEVLPGKVTFASYRDSLIAHLRGIDSWFGTGEGTRLQYEDSELALSVMTAMEAEGVPVLPIHDSFIVAARHEEQLELAMLDAFFTSYGDVPLIDRKGPPATAFPGGTTGP